MMMQWLRVASLLPCALALRASEPPHHVKQVAIIGMGVLSEVGYVSIDFQQVPVQVAHPPRTISPNMPPKQAFQQTSLSSIATTISVAAQRP
jgi:hypothetical protein